MATYFVKAPTGASYGPADLDELRAWLAQGRLASDAVLQDSETGETFTAGTVPGLFAEPMPPPPIANPTPAVTATDHMVPTKNPRALLSYYIGLFSIIPCFGLFLGPIAIVLGRRGLRESENLPERLGRGHAIAGLALGGVGSVIGYGILILVIIGIATGTRS